MRHQIRLERRPNEFPPEEQFAWTLARFAVHATLDQVPRAAQDMVCNRIIDTHGVALHALNHEAVIAARRLYSDLKWRGNSTMLGMPPGIKFPDFVAGFVNAVAARDDDWHDCFLAAEYSHPADLIAGILAKAQDVRADGNQVLLALAVAYEVQCSFVRTVCLHENKMDHGTWILLGLLCGLSSLCQFTEKQAYDAICIGLHQGFSTRGGRRGNMSPHKAFHPGYMTKIALEAVNLAAQGINGPNPIFEGVDGPFSWMMKFRARHEIAKTIRHFEDQVRNAGIGNGLEPISTTIDVLKAHLETLKDAYYEVELPGSGEEIGLILKTWTKEHPTEYQSQALIDGAWELHNILQAHGGHTNIANVVLKTSNHTHMVIGSGEGTPEKMAPKDGAPIPSRETLDHCAPATAAIAIVHGEPANGQWDISDYDKAADPEVQAVWANFTTEEDPEWTRRYHAGEAFGGEFVVTLKNGQVITHRQDVARAHPKHPSGGFTREDYLKKFIRTSEGVIKRETADWYAERIFGLAQLDDENIACLGLKAEVELL